MQQEKRSTKPGRRRTDHENLTMSTMARKRHLNQPFPLKWGIAAIALFSVFAGLTQLQFNHTNQDALYRARVDDYLSDVQNYNAIVKSHETCIRTIQHSVVDQKIFDGIASILQESADLPATLFPKEPRAIDYQKELTKSIKTLIRDQIAKELPPRSESDCPVIPPDPPKKPTR